VKLFSFGGKLLLSSLLETGYMNLRSLVIGKLYAPAILAYYNKGDVFPKVIVSNINGSIQSVIFPVLSSEQKNKLRVKQMVRRTIVTSSYLIFPMMIGLGVIGEPLIRLLLTEKWLPSVFFLRVACLSYALWPIHTANLQAINALGKSDIFLKLEIIKKILGIGILFITIQYGIRAIALGMLVSSVISSFVNAYPNKYLLNYGYSEQIKDVLPSLLLAGLMGWMTYLITLVGLSDIFTLIVQITAGAFIYIVLSYFLKLECFLYLVMTIRDIIRKNNKKI
jgi:O-antigen/teichoic acid export membrane protein